MYLISAYFDDNANRILQGYIEKIASVSGNTFMIDNNVPPHLTISAIEARNIDVLVPGFDSLKGELTQGEIQFVSIGQLLPYVIYTTPVLNEYLQNMILTVNDAYKDVPETSISKFYKPNSWLAHTTLGKTLSKEQMLDAFSIMQTSFAPFKATVTEIGLAKVNPHMDVERFSL